MQGGGGPIIELNKTQDGVAVGNLIENYDGVTGNFVSGVTPSYRNSVISRNIFRKFDTTQSSAVTLTFQATALNANYERIHRTIIADNICESLQFGVFDSNQASCTPGRESLNVVINNNTFKDMTQRGISLWGVNKLTINGNIFDDVGTGNNGTGYLEVAVLLEDVYNAIVSNNVMTNSVKGTGFGPWIFCGVRECDDITITGNQINDTRYGYGYLSIAILNTTPTNVRVFDNVVDGIFIPGIEKVGLIRAVYDFAVDGGVAGAIGTGTYIPYGGVITRSYYQVVTQPDSAGGTATVAIGYPTDDATGIKAAIDEDDATWAVGWHNGIQDGTLANFSEDATDNREITITIANENLTAGKFVVYCEYIISYSAVYTGKG
jgi:hypothetical protein